MLTKGVNIISNSIYINAPDWLSIPDNRSYIILNKDTPRQDVDLFIFGLFVYNEIPLTDNSKESLRHLQNRFIPDEIALSGGVMFYDGDVKILPGCCAGVEQWREVVEDISNKKEIWLGHDPYPTIEYKDNSIIVWSDDYSGVYSSMPKSKLQSIAFTNDELNDLFAQLKADIKEFIAMPLDKRLKEIDYCISESLTSCVMEWLNIN